MKKVISVVGARPNFMKVAPIYHSSKDAKFEHKIVHTGQHYDYNLSDRFFIDLELPKPDYFLGVGSGSHSVQTAKIMIEFEKVLEIEKPDLVIVVGDVNSTIACGLVAVKMGIKLAHIEAGLRSSDRTMPEEINRIATDAISDYYFITEQSALDHLIFSGVPEEKIFFVGNTMIDSLVKGLEKAELSSVLENYQLTPGEYILATLHRPNNVDNKQSLEDFLDVFQSISKNIKIVFPIHPRTTSKLTEFGLLAKFKSLENLVIIPPAPYIDFLKLMKYAKLVMTDSGGIQEETTYLDVPCLTLRTTTERPITIEIGSNLLINPNKDNIIDALDNSLKNPKKRMEMPLLWDGQAATRIVKIIENKILG